MRAAAGATAARDRLRLGRAGRDARRAEFGGARHRRHAVDRAARLRAAAAARARAARSAPTCACRTTATSRDAPFDAIVLDRDVRGRRPRILARLLRHAARSLLKPGGARLHPEHHHPRRPVRALRRARPTSSSSTSFPAACCPAPSVFRQQAEAAGLTVVQRTGFGADYAETLRRWRARFLAREAEVRGLRLRHPLHAHLGVLPGLLRGGVRHRQHRRRAVHAAAR